MILVVGDVMTDILVRPSGPLRLGTDCPAEISPAAGGSGANVACWLGRLGVPVRFAGRVSAGDHAAQTAAFARHRVEPWLGSDERRATGMIVALIGVDGERSFYTDRGANLALCRADLPDALLDGVRRLHVSGYALFAPGPREAARALIDAARRRGIALSVDAGSSAFLQDVDPELFRFWTRGADICFANAAEAAVLAATDTDYACRVVTRGAAGASAWSGAEHASVPAAEVAVRDTAGAGDAFTAGFLAAWVAGSGLPTCLRAAVRCGGIAAGLAGARPDADIGL